MGDTAAAEQELQRILQKKPDHAPSKNDLGYLWAERGVKLGRAEAMIRRHSGPIPRAQPTSTASDGLCTSKDASATPPKC